MNHLPTNPTIGDMVRAGALGRALRRVASGWRDESILLHIEAAYPGAFPAQYREILRMAHEAYNAAQRQKALPRDDRLDVTNIPVVPR